MEAWTEPNPAHEQVELVLQSVDSLPTLSPVANRVLSIGSSERADFRELTRLIEADPALTSRIIGLCRRAALGLGDRITTVKRALVMLGFDAVRAAVLSVSVYDLLTSEARARAGDAPEPAGLPRSERRFDRAGFWTYSVGVASAAELLAREHRRLRVKPDEAFVAGLLHGLGKPILELLLPGAYGRVLELAEERRSDAAPVEREVLGIDHHAAGRRIAERWGLPSALRDVVWLYDHPIAGLPEGVDADAVRLVSVARALTREMHLGESGDWGVCVAASEVASEAGISPATLDRVAKRLPEAVAERCKVLGLDEQAPPEILLRSISAANRRLAQLTEDLDRRAREGERVGLVLGAIDTFWSRGGDSGHLVRTLEAMAASASSVLGRGRWVAVLDRGRGRGWMVCAFVESSGPPVPRNVAPPPSLADLDLSDARGWADRSGVRSTLADWAWGQSGLDRSGADLRVVVACRGERVQGCVLVTDAPAPACALEDRHLDPLRAGWSAALSAAIHRAATERLAESLADSNRALASAQAKLTEAQALARLGEMTAGAAHEMNNPLTVIRGRAQMLAERLEGEQDRTIAARIASAAGDLSDLVTALHEIARPGTAARSPVGLGGLISRASSLSGGPPPRVEFGEGLGSGDAPVLADADRLSRALAELLRNAREWSGEGIVTVRAHIAPPDGRLVIRIEDDGPGPSARAQRHAFDPFFSERPAGRGRGLGLPLAKRLVELHGGTVRLEPGASGGAVAVVTLAAWRVDSEREAGRAA